MLVVVFLLVVYVDDIVITSIDSRDNNALKSRLHGKLQTKDFGTSKLSWVEETRSRKKIFCSSQRKYVLDEAGLTRSETR